MARSRISVVVPAYRADATLPLLLDALAEQDLAPLETLVVDSSPDGEGARRAVAGRERVRLVRLDARTPPQAARNRGAALAQGEAIAFTDADCAPRPQWLARLARELEDGRAIVGGAVEPAGGGWSSRGVHWSKFGAWSGAGPPGPRPSLVTANLALTRAAWERVGPFRLEGWSGDTELCWRARRAGLELHFEPGAVVLHHHTLRLAPQLAERVQRGEAFAALRMRAERWPRRRTALTLAAMPLVPPALLGTRLRQAGRAGRLSDALATAPVQLLADAAWALGEARAQARTLSARR